MSGAPSVAPGGPTGSATPAAIARVDLTALRHNLARVRSAAPNSRVMAVIKGNGYGHGLLPVARALATADGLAVARVDEAVALRDGGITTPLLVLEGFHDRAELGAIAELGVACAVHTSHQLAMLDALEAVGVRGLPVWLKLDTGMHRLGFPPGEFGELVQRLRANPAVDLACVMSHFACADDRNDPFTARQIETFANATGAFEGARSIANSAAVLGWPESHKEWVRPGIMLYGASPFSGGRGGDDGLRPAMSFKSRLIAIHELADGERVGYGGTWTSRGCSRIGVVAAGYADGYPREAPSGTPVLIGGVRAPLAGRVSMDMLTVDLSGHPDAAIGDEVVLWGEGLPSEEVAEHMHTIAYTLFCGITQRTHREYVGVEE